MRDGRLRESEGPREPQHHGVVGGRGGTFVRQGQRSCSVQVRRCVIAEGDDFSGVGRGPVIRLQHSRIGYENLKVSPSLASKMMRPDASKAGVNRLLGPLIDMAISPALPPEK